MQKSKDHLICFDLDGVLISSMVIANQLFYDTVEEILGLPTTHLRPQKKLMALSVEERMATLWNQEIEKEGISQQQIKKTIDLYRERKMSAGIPILPHAKEAVGLMAEHFEFMACVSNNPEAIIEQTLADAGLLHYFSKLTGIDHIEFSKPHPQMYASTVDYFGMQPQHCLTFEDSTAGISSAKGAGMKVVGVATGLESVEELQKTPADRVWEDLSMLELSRVNELFS